MRRALAALTIAISATALGILILGMPLTPADAAPTASSSPSPSGSPVPGINNCGPPGGSSCAVFVTPSTTSSPAPSGSPVPGIVHCYPGGTTCEAPGPTPKATTSAAKTLPYTGLRSATLLVSVAALLLMAGGSLILVARGPSDSPQR